MRALAVSVVLAMFAVGCGGSGPSSAPAEATADAGDERSDGPGDTANNDAAPEVGDHWHAAYGIFVCDSFVQPVADESDPEGIHSHGDGVIHIHPFFDSAAGANATIGKFFEAVQIEVTDEGVFGPGGSLEEGLDCTEGPAEFKVARWSLSGLNEAPELVDQDIANIRFREDLEIFTIGFVAAGTELTPPPSIGNLGTISDVDPADVPELPPGFSVAVIAPPEPGGSIDGETPCPAVDGSGPRITEFENSPPMCIDPSLTYTATIATNLGDLVVELDTESTPETVNNFVVLALYHYYDDTQLFRTAPSIAIVQGGAPHTNSAGDPGPGYTIEDEADGFTYVAGDIAMARTPAPNSASAQFFFGAGPEVANLDGEPGNPDGSGRGTYVRFGRTISGLDVLEQILSLHVADPALAGGGPSEAVIIDTVTIDVGAGLG